MVPAGSPAIAALVQLMVEIGMVPDKVAGAVAVMVAVTSVGPGGRFTAISISSGIAAEPGPVFDARIGVAGVVPIDAEGTEKLTAGVPV